MNVLVTGGAGYIGSHAVKLLLDRGHKVVVADDLSHGFQQAVDPRASFVKVSTEETEILSLTMKEYQVEAIIHFAAYIEVGESYVDPFKYYRNNVANAVSLFEAARAAEVRKIVFSSTAAVYGNPTVVPIPEDAPTLPVNPYGHSKLMVEQVLADAARAYGLGYVVLRYFNVAGASPDGSIGEAHEPETHLIPNILGAALKEGAKMKLFGTDYPTPDGTCVRDYVHVMDLVEAHLLALAVIEPGKGKTYNLGSESGFSVREVIAACERVTGRPVEVEEHPRRAGDSASLVAKSERARSELGWKPRYPDLDTIIAHAWTWHQKLDSDRREAARLKALLDDKVSATGSDPKGIDDSKI